MPTQAVTSQDHRALQTIADTIHKSKRIVVITGAGISTNSGIPDFRSTHGLYNQVKARYPSAAHTNITQGKDLFDSVLFSDPTMTSIFYTFLAELRNSVLKVEDTTPTHKFIRTLAETGRLLRCYTQNIDGLEGREGLVTDLSLGKGSGIGRKRKRCSLAGVTGEAASGNSALSSDLVTAPPRGCQVVQLHGELDTLRCMHCQGKCEYTSDRVAALMDGQAPDCPQCLEKDKERREAGKRGTRVGGLRPNIVLYGEEHPQGDLIGSITTADLSAKPDLMIIFGTSLKVHGLKRLVKTFAAAIKARNKPSTNTTPAGDDGGGKGMWIPRVIFVNNQPAANSVWKDVIDAWVDMDCDQFVAEVKKRRPAVWERQEKLEAGFRRIVEGRVGKGQGAGTGKGEKVVKNAHRSLVSEMKDVKGVGEESDKENLVKNKSVKGIKGGSKSEGSTPSKNAPSRKKLPLTSSSSKDESSVTTITVCTPKHKKTPLPTPPSSVSKSKVLGNKGRLSYLNTKLLPSTPQTPSCLSSSSILSPFSRNRSPSMSPLTPCPSDLEMSPTWGREGFGFDFYATPSRSRVSNGEIASSECEEGTGTSDKMRKVGVDMMEEVRRGLFTTSTTTDDDDSTLKDRGGQMLEAVVIMTPSKAKSSATAVAGAEPLFPSSSSTISAPIRKQKNTKVMRRLAKATVGNGVGEIRETERQLIMEQVAVAEGGKVMGEAQVQRRSERMRRTMGAM